MRSAFAAPLLVLASFLGVVVAQDPLTIFTPPTPPVICQPTLLTWRGGSPPYIVSVFNSDEASTIVSFPDLTNTSITWHVTTAAGTNVLLTIKDTTGLTQNSSPLVVGAGSTSCLTSASRPAGSSTSGSKPAGSSTSSGTKTTTVTSTSTTTTAVNSASLTAPPSSQSSSAPAVGSNLASSASQSAPSTSPSTGAAAPENVPLAAAVAALGAVFAALL
ncbi:hypothetical protein R3P38DRAFT_2834649 [Favolaschia claudopus]|uniref:Uncharacterized protein n=1 Tax=Favolaschia claudopus TaxID=2862362 RepID=A0AAW0EFI8_9AGAR